MKWTVPSIWQDGECWIIGGGPSMPRQFHVPEELIQDVMTGRTRPNAYSPYLAPIHDKHVIGVNNTYLLGHWLDVIFFGDCSWYLVHQKMLAKFPGMKVTCCPRFANRDAKQMEGIKYLAKDKKREGISSDKSMVSWNNNSGAAAISLAVHFGVKRIFLLGFDMSLDQGNVSHWHGSHRKELTGVHKNKRGPFIPPFARHMKGFPEIAKDAKKMGVEILNVSPKSAILDFKRCSVDEILGNTEAVA